MIRNGLTKESLSEVAGFIFDSLQEESDFALQAQADTEKYIGNLQSHLYNEQAIIETIGNHLIRMAGTIIHFISIISRILAMPPITKLNLPCLLSKRLPQPAL